MNLIFSIMSLTSLLLLFTNQNWSLNTTLSAMVLAIMAITFSILAKIDANRKKTIKLKITK